MNDYECYDRTSTNYDATRCAVGVEILLGCFASVGQPLETMTVLDAACGTGNYALEVGPKGFRIN